MKYYIGIDAGGTGTNIIIGDQDGNELISGETSQGNINIVAPKDFEEALSSKIDELLGLKDLSKGDCLGLCLGAAGADNTKNIKIYNDILANLGLSGEKVLVTDAEIGLYGSLGEGYGIVLVAGTGSICFAVDKDGNKHRVGGWGHIISDEGSGYHIGIMVLRKVMQAYDDGKESYLKEGVFEHFNITSYDELIKLIYSDTTDKKTIASLSLICERAYEKGHEDARSIMHEAGLELASLIGRLYDKAFHDDELCNWSYGGSIMVKSDYIRNLVESETSKKYPNLTMLAPKNIPAYGAMAMIKDIFES